MGGKELGGIIQQGGRDYPWELDLKRAEVSVELGVEVVLVTFGGF